MDRLEEQFGDQVEFVHLDVDQSHSRDILSQFGVRGRSQYLLVNADGTILHHWFGSISGRETEIAASIETALAAP